jgi:sec-independent protein translocase protein TatA
MPSIGWPELIIIAVIVLLLFGAKKLPEIARSVGESVREFQKGVQTPTNGTASEEPKAEDTK